MSTKTKQVRLQCPRQVIVKRFRDELGVTNELAEQILITYQRVFVELMAEGEYDRYKLLEMVNFDITEYPQKAYYMPKLRETIYKDPHKRVQARISSKYKHFDNLKEIAEELMWLDPLSRPKD